jgi:hypothetical protein
MPIKGDDGSALYGNHITGRIALWGSLAFLFEGKGGSR